MDGRNEKQDQGRRLAGVVLEEKKRRDAEAFIQMKERLHQQEGIFFLCDFYLFIYTLSRHFHIIYRLFFYSLLMKFVLILFFQG